jgi:hypothetical protein
MVNMRMKNEGRVCELEECALPAKKRGYCKTHYQRFRIHGDASIVIGKPSGTLYKWIVDHKEFDGDACLDWPFSKDNNGRGQIYHKGGMKKAHRVMCEEVHGAPPTPKHEAAHSCGKGHLGCVAPGHLGWKTHKENIADKLIHGTHNRGERHVNAKLTEVEAREIIALKGEMAQKDIANRFGVSRQAIGLIHQGRNWGWLDA